MERSKSIAGIIGPVLVMMTASELKAWNPTLYDSQVVPLIYLSGILFFTAGIAVVRVHNIWIWGWQTCITVIGWAAILLGLYRMFFPSYYQSQFTNGVGALTIEVSIILLGLFLTIKAYCPLRNRE